MPFRSLTLQEVRYQYRGEDGERFTLGPLNLQFTPGELVFVVGGNGSGKTTLANLLVGLYPPDSGAILLNGSKIAADQQAGYRQLFSVVFSDFFLFDDVAFIHERTPAQVAHLLHLLKLSHKVRFQNGRFSTTALSQGQRKRLALLQAGWRRARCICLMSGPPIRTRSLRPCFTRSCCQCSKPKAGPSSRSPTTTATFTRRIGLSSWSLGRLCSPRVLRAEARFRGDIFTRR